MDTGESLETKIQTVTSQAVINLNLDSIGTIKEGHYADLVLFNPETLKDNATYEQSSLRVSGIELVLVSGEVVYRNQSPTGKYVGRILRRN